VGGGVIGTGIARDAALRGLRVALFEQDDFGAGTSSRSTRLIHGGLRYLAQLDFGLVRDDLRERELLLRNAPHLVRPLPFLVPIYERGLAYRLKLRAGMLLYDLLSHGKSLPAHTMLNHAETLQREPGLNPRGLQGAALYWDAQITYPERLCIENAVDAEAHGALLRNHAQVVAPVLEAGRLTGVSVRDRLTGNQVEGPCGCDGERVRPVARRRGGGPDEEREPPHTPDKGHPPRGAEGDRARRRSLLSRRPAPLLPDPVARIHLGRHDRHGLRG
jgi:glycerol-3-phosphate dehydrogenase